jgi:hypothetical protein
MRSQLNAKAEPLESLARSFASIAQSFREYVELYRANSGREAAKGRRPNIVSVSTANYQRESEKQQDVPGFRVSGKIPEKNTSPKQAQ